MFISLPDAKLYASSFGPKTGTPILALSGWIGSSEVWAETFSILSDEWHTISFDHRGTGATISSVETITLDTLVDDVFAVLDAYNIDKCILASMSMGVAIAFSAALRDPERFSGLITINGALARNTSGGTDPFLIRLQQDYFQAIETFANASVPEEECGHIKRWRRQIMERASKEAAIALYRLLGSIDVRKDLVHLEHPALVIHGDADTLVSIESARWLASTLPNAKLAILEGAGHVPMMTRPRDVAQEINSTFGVGSSTLERWSPRLVTAPLYAR